MLPFMVNKDVYMNLHVWSYSRHSDMF